MIHPNSTDVAYYVYEWCEILQIYKPQNKTNREKKTKKTDI